MGGRGPAPKPSHLRQRTNRKPGAQTLTAPESPDIPPLEPRPDGEPWHPQTLVEWDMWWRSPMSTAWIETDVGQLFVVALSYDNVMKNPGNTHWQTELRLQRPCFGLTPVDRSRLQWEVSRGEEAERKRQRPEPIRRTGTDPRAILMPVIK
jgi:hypothetical protein